MEGGEAAVKVATPRTHYVLARVSERTSDAEFVDTVERARSRAVDGPSIVISGCLCTMWVSWTVPRLVTEVVVFCWLWRAAKAVQTVQSEAARVSARHKQRKSGCVGFVATLEISQGMRVGVSVGTTQNTTQHSTSWHHLPERKRKIGLGTRWLRNTAG
jgi:hypothetical protein